MGRPLGSKNKKTLKRSLIDDITSQEERFVKRENTRFWTLPLGTMKVRAIVIMSKVTIV